MKRCVIPIGTVLRSVIMSKPVKIKFTVTMCIIIVVIILLDCSIRVFAAIQAHYSWGNNKTTDANVLVVKYKRCNLHYLLYDIVHI